MASYLEELKRAFLSPAPYLAWLAISAIFALTGPFGTYVPFDFSERLVFWSTVAAASVAWGTALRVFLMNRFRHLGYWRGVAIASTVSGCVLAVPIYHLILMRGGDGSVQFRPAMELAFTIFVGGVAIGWLRHFMGAGEGAEGAEETRQNPRLLDRIEPTKRGDLIRMSARDHYLEVVTHMGKVELLMRFSDALAELDGIDGLQVHRSHWVAAGAVSGAEKQGDKLMLVTTDGARVPVSRKHRPDVLARGLVD